MTTEKIVSIKKIGTGKVRNLTVYKNHTFLTGNGIVTHNCERISPQGQDALKVTIEQCEKNARFILCTNNLHKVIAPLHSRCQQVDFSYSKEEKKEIVVQYFKRCAFILKNEDVEYEKEVLLKFIQLKFPDFRKIINELQKYSRMSDKIDVGVLRNSTEHQLENIIKVLQNKNYTELRKVAADADSSNFYTEFYNHLSKFVKESCIKDLILIIGEYAHNHTQTIDQEINLLCCLIEIERAADWK